MYAYPSYLPIVSSLLCPVSGRFHPAILPLLSQFPVSVHPISFPCPPSPHSLFEALVCHNSLSTRITILLLPLYALFSLFTILLGYLFSFMGKLLTTWHSSLSPSCIPPSLYLILSIPPILRAPLPVVVTGVCTYPYFFTISIVFILFIVMVGFCDIDF